MLKEATVKEGMIHRIWSQTMADDCPDLAAQISFFFVLSLFPFFLVMAGIVGWAPSGTLWPSIAHWIIRYMPAESQDFAFGIVLDLKREHTGFFSLGLVAMIWSASSGIVSVMESLTLAYGAVETRGFWRKHFIAMATVIAGVAYCLGSYGLLRLGRWLVHELPHNTRIFSMVQSQGAAVSWLATLVLMCLALDLATYFLPAGKRPWRWLPPSTLFVAITYGIASAAFNYYVRHFTSFPEVYGALAGFVVLMLWIYVASLILLIGAETERIIEQN